MRRRLRPCGPPSSSRATVVNLLLITGLTLALLATMGTPDAQADFDFEFLGQYGHKMSVTIDKGGHYHISHIIYESRSSWLKYSTNRSGTWVTERLTYASGNELYTSAIALDSRGSVHIAYISGREVLHLTNSTGDWETAPITKGIDDLADPGLSRLAIDDEDCLHLSYNDWEEIGYATACGDDWRTYAVPETEATYSGVNVHALALDARNRPHISYKGQNGLRHAVLEPVEVGRPPYSLTPHRWSTELVDERLDVGANDIAIGGDGQIHISYYARNRPDEPWSSSLNHAVRCDLGWVIEDDIGGDGDDVQDDDLTHYPGKRQHVMQLDRNGNVHIVYGLGILTHGDVEYAIEYITDRSGRWTHPDPDEIYWYHNPTEFRDIDLVTDGDCGIHILFNVPGSRMTALAYDPNGCPFFPGLSPILKPPHGIMGLTPIPMGLNPMP